MLIAKTGNLLKRLDHAPTFFFVTFGHELLNECFQHLADRDSFGALLLGYLRAIDEQLELHFQDFGHHGEAISHDEQVNFADFEYKSEHCPSLKFFFTHFASKFLVTAYNIVSLFKSHSINFDFIEQFN